MVVCGILYSYRENELKLSQGSLNDKKISYLVSYFTDLAWPIHFQTFVCLFHQYNSWISPADIFVT